MLLIGNGRLITRSGEELYLEDGCVAIEGTRIAEIASTGELRAKYPGAEWLDAGGRVIMPGMINTHMHLYSTFARGMALKDASPGNFPEILERLWWRLDKTLTADDIYYSALVPLLDCIKNGTTTIFDHHASPSAVTDSLFILGKACRETGVRSCLCYEVSDRDGEEVAARGIAENVAFSKACRDSGDEMLQGMFGLHASFTLSDRTLERCAQAVQGTGAGFHVHTAEGREDALHCQERYGKRVVERFRDSGLLNEKTIAVHCVHVNETEMDILRETGANVVHNPESNMGNAVGGAPVIEMMRRGVRVGLGTDGYTTDMFESLKAANLLHKHRLQDPGAAWVEPPAMLFQNNRTIAGRYFPEAIGRIEAGACADIIIVDYQPPTPLTVDNINGHILFGMSGRAVDTTVINGRIVMKERRFTEWDEQEVNARARELAADVWRRF